MRQPATDPSSKSGFRSGMASFRQTFRSLTANDCVDWRLRISVPAVPVQASPLEKRHAIVKAFRHFGMLPEE
jgi:hypothetical protein